MLIQHLQLSIILTIYIIFQHLDVIVASGQYCDQKNNCQQCDTDCLSCEKNIKNCLSCETKKYLYKKKCLTEQPKQVYCENNICTQCKNDKCQTCEDNLKDCITCTSKYPFFYNKNCSSQQVSGTYCNQNKECQACDNQSCRECDSNLNDCLRCKTGYQFNGQCFQSQNEIEGVFCKNSICQQCDAQNCLTCKQDLQQCQTCKKKEFLYGQNCYPEQQETTYCNPTNSYYNCKKCKNLNCLKCYGNLQSCQTCKVGYNQLKYQCCPNIIDGTYCDEKNMCKKCRNPNCYQCDETLFICTSCRQNEYLMNGFCEPSQPPNAICDPQNKCKQCDPNCLTCENDINFCTSCNVGLELQNNKCVQKWDYDSFCENNKCQDCKNKNCRNCDSDLKKCLSCYSDKYLYNNQCQTFGKCENEYCGRCSNKYFCSQCKDSMYLFRGFCTYTKPIGVYINKQNYCLPCSNKSCLECSEDRNICISCKQNEVLKYNNCYSFFQDGDEQPEGTYCYKNKCLSCINLKCKTCSDDLKTCLTLKQDSSCSISDGEYCNEEGVCQNCSVENCGQCSELDTCDSCIEGFKYDVKQNKCIEDDDQLNCPKNQFSYDDQCFQVKPENTYCNQQTMKCKQCEDKNCYECKDDLKSCIKEINNNDQTCSNNEFSYNNQCYSSVPENTYCNKQTMKCKECENKNCSQCNEDLKSCKEKINDSISCSSNQFLYNNECHSVIPQNTFCNEQTMECKQCESKNCFECQEDLKSCKNCKPNTFEYEMKCYDEKPKNVYCKEQDQSASKDVQKCFKCHEKCYKCFGPNQNDCPQDDLGQILLPNTVLEYKSSFTNQEVLKINQLGQTVSQAQSQSSIALSVSSSLVSSTSFGILVTGLSSQKLSYSTLIETNLPPQVYAPLKATSGKQIEQDNNYFH